MARITSIDDVSHEELFAELQRVYEINDRNRVKFEALKAEIGKLRREKEFAVRMAAAAGRIQSRAEDNLADIIAKAAGISGKKREN